MKRYTYLLLVTLLASCQSNPFENIKLNFGPNNELTMTQFTINEDLADAVISLNPHVDGELDGEAIVNNYVKARDIYRNFKRLQLLINKCKINRTSTINVLKAYEKKDSLINVLSMMKQLNKLHTLKLDKGDIDTLAFEIYRNELFYTKAFQGVLKHRIIEISHPDSYMPLVYDETTTKNGDAALIIYITAEMKNRFNSTTLWVNDSIYTNEDVIEDGLYHRGKMHVLTEDEVEDSISIATLTMGTVAGGGRGVMIKHKLGTESKR